jgi:hypothetical protein
MPQAVDGAELEPVGQDVATRFDAARTVATGLKGGLSG